MLRESLLKKLIIVLFEPKKLKREKVMRYYYRFEEPCKKQQGVNVEKVDLLLLTMFNSSDHCSPLNNTGEKVYSITTILIRWK